MSTTTTHKKSLVVLISGSGTNLQAIIDAIHNGVIANAEIKLVVSNRKDAYGLKRAQAANIPTLYSPLKPYTYPYSTLLISHFYTLLHLNHNFIVTSPFFLLHHYTPNFIPSIVFIYSSHSNSLAYFFFLPPLPLFSLTLRVIMARQDNTMTQTWQTKSKKSHQI